jgi:hypothetical protein
VEAGIEHISPHDLRHASGQWLLDVGIPIELVSRFLGHANTAITERVYARIKKEVVGDRMLDSVDPRYARRANHARSQGHRVVETITKLPAPRQPVLFTVGESSRTLSDWARVTGIAKATLHHRVVVSGLDMGAAIALGHGVRGRPLREFSGVRFCRVTPAKLGDEPPTSETSEPGSATAPSAFLPEDLVRRDGIEPPTRGFSSGAIWLLIQ